MLRYQLGKCNALVSGAFALNLFEFGHPKVQCLDVFVQNGVDSDRLTRYIEENENYQNDSLDVGMHRAVRHQNPDHFNERVPGTLDSHYLEHNRICQLHYMEQSILDFPPTNHQGSPVLYDRNC
ncbi:uncharacterized protein PgNI_12157 [Pyricularia grisea]|uniref:Uncharacterized protein n=1 Tax=Pyricularia grisea TaxID=148305 RepID=A0A6P8AR12_PYRGI|nr:uncharacterized protein PgNI_12157 [Pyricularia grisea]TLD04481.1 hypothetical protein PgNI_12157 [Pyricularia grisea]